MDHTIALIEKSHNGDKEAREQLVEENIGLIWCVVKRFYGRGNRGRRSFSDREYRAYQAIDKFDLSYDVKFSTYAVPMISGEIKRFLRDDGMIKVSRSLKELSYRIFQTREKMTDGLGREPTLEELSQEMGVEKEELVQAMEASGEVESLYRPIHQKEGSEISLLDKLEEKEHREEKILDRMLLGQLLEKLDGQERLDLSAVFCGKNTVGSGKRNGNFPGSGVQNGKENHSKFKRDDALRNRIVKGIFFHGCQILRSE